MNMLEQSNFTSVAAEAQRQQQFLAALWNDSSQSPELLHANIADRKSGLHIYRSNGFAVAERALSGSFPTVQAILGDEGFAVLCKHLWRDSPPTSGDLGAYGDTLANYVAAQTDDALVDLPFLSDVARLDWAIHQVERAADSTPLDPSRWALLSTPDLTRVHFEFAAATALIQSPHPIVSIYNAHQSNDFSALNQGAATRSENAWVHRNGFRAVVSVMSDADANFTQALQRGSNLADALGATDDPAFDFTHWLTRAAQTLCIANITFDTQP
jgi:hypothetical protein